MVQTFKPVHPGHVVVKQGQIKGAVGADGSKALIKRTGACHIKIAFCGEKHRERFPHEIVVVGEENTRSHCNAARKSVAVTVVFKRPVQ